MFSAQRTGFTIIELVMVVTLLAIMAAVGFVAISSHQTQYLYAAAERVAADLRYTKNLSLSSTIWHGALFQTNTYRLYQTDGATDVNIKDPADPGQDYIVNLNLNYGGVTITSVNLGGGNKVEFDPYGVPYTDKNGSALSSNGSITLGKNGSSLNVYVAPQSGRIYIQ